MRRRPATGVRPLLGLAVRPSCAESGGYIAQEKEFSTKLAAGPRGTLTPLVAKLAAKDLFRFCDYHLIPRYMPPPATSASFFRALNPSSALLLPFFQTFLHFFVPPSRTLLKISPAIASTTNTRHAAETYA